MSRRIESVEEWARTHTFSQPVRLGEVEAGVLARPPARDSGAGWAYPLVAIVSWGAFALAFLLGMGATLIALVLVLVGSTRDDAASAETWLGFASFVFGVTVVVEVSLLYHWWRERRRSGAEMAGAITTTASGVVSLVLLQRAPEGAAPFYLVPLIAGAIVLALASLVANVVARPASGRPSRKKPPRRGPRSALKADRYERTRGLVLDILAERRLLRLDDTERQRILQMPLGYWEELDDVEEKERRRILEYRTIGWREFDARDERPWPPT